MTADPWRRLAAGVLLQACLDAQGKGFQMEPGDQEDAIAWLRSAEARDLAAALDLDLSLERWLAAGMPQSQERAGRVSLTRRRKKAA